MSALFVFFTAIALSMDAFAVSVSCGITQSAKTIQKKLQLALAFGIFQGIMPVASFHLSKLISIDLGRFTGVLVFLIMLGIGIHMIRESFKLDEECGYGVLSISKILILALATSIDAFAAGITFAVMDANIWVAAGEIAAITFVISIAGVYFGCKIGSFFKKGAEITGGIILILIGIKYLIEVWI